jgi:hypothetical protein
MKNKYRSKKTNGFDSKKEAKRYGELLILEKAGVITSLDKQVPLVLLKSFKDKAGNSERGIKYIADFVYYDKEKKSCVIEDVKSPITKKLPSYVIKRKLVKKFYPDYLFLEV